MSLCFALEPEQHARWLALLERLRKQGYAEAKDELPLAAFAALAEAECTRVQNEPPYQVVVYRCEECGAVRLPNGRNSAANLITLCAACHRLLHESGVGLAATLPVAALPNTG